MNNEPSSDFIYRAQRLGEHRARTGRWPSRHSADAAERILWSWHTDLKCTARGTRKGRRMMTMDQRQALDKHAPGWDVPTRKLVPFEEALEAIAQFRDQHDRWPRQTEGAEALRMFQWLGNVRSAHRGYGTMRIDEQRLATLDSRLPEWNCPWYDLRFEENLGAYCDFLTAHGRAPRKRSTGEEQRLYGWMGRVRTGILKWDANRERRMENVDPDWQVAPSLRVD